MESELSRVVDSLPGLVWTARPSGEADFVNQRWCEYTGLTVDEAYGRGWLAAIHPDDLAGLLAGWQSILDSGEPRELEARMRRFDGVYRWFAFRERQVLDPSGRIVKWCGINTDIEERKRAEDELRERASQFRAIADCVPALIAVMSSTGAVENVNRHVLEYFNATLDELKAWTTGDFCHPDDLPAIVAAWTRSVNTGEPYEIEHRMRRADGVYRWFRARGLPLKDSSAAVTRWYVLQTDIDDQKRAEQALRASEFHLRQIIDSIPGLLCTMSPSGEVELFNRQVLEYFGKTPEELKGWATSEAVHPDDQSRVIAAFANSATAGTPYEVKCRFRRADGVYRWFQVRGLPVRDADARITVWYDLLTDIDDFKHAEDAIRASEQHFKQIINTIPALAWSARPDGSAEFFNQHYLDYVGLSAEQAQDWGWTAAVHPDDLDHLSGAWERITTVDEAGEVEARLRRFDGAYRWFLLRTNPLRDEFGNTVKWYGTNTDIDDRKRAEEKLRLNEAFLAKGQRLSVTGTFSWHVNTDEIVFSEQLYRIFDFEQDEPVTLERMGGRVHPEDITSFSKKLGQARTAGSDLDYEIRLRMPDDSVKYLHTIAYATQDPNGQLEIIGAVQDITERRLSEDALGKVRSELARVARVTTLGAMTASIAHEIKQPLSSIILNAGTCQRMLATNPPNVDDARETTQRIIRDGKRASDVMTRLRSLFAKKIGASEPIDLSEAAREVIALSWGELQANRVVLRDELATEIPRVMGDRVQLQQVVLNLLLNASDAMSRIHDRPRQIVIKTQPDEGDRVRLTVQDAGVGIEPEAANKLFEAFYTTKEGGMGIGLSVSRSIIESHRGRIWASANDGPGASFSFSIPCRPDGAAGPSTDGVRPYSAVTNA
ncbi:MAG: PAS domain-containing protein [Candidatus Velthaea sp.]|jgi:PAS domain S-box-containing protein